MPPQAQLREQLSHLGLAIVIRFAAGRSGRCRRCPADAVRTQRALEVLYATGRPMSSQATAVPPPWRVLELGLDPANLRQRIQQRTDQLYADGLVEETRQLAERYGTDLPLLQTIGYGEALQLIQGTIGPAKATDHHPADAAVRQATAHLVPPSAPPHWLEPATELDQAMTLIQQHLR